MKFSLQRELLLKPLQFVCNVSDKKQNLPILSNTLISIEQNRLYLIGSDLEVELVGVVQLTDSLPTTTFTVPARKLLDICRSLPEQSVLEFSCAPERVTIKSAKSRFALSTLPASDFPKIEGAPGDVELSVRSADLKQLLEKTHFSMAANDVRYYLNGLLLKLQGEKFISVATDGHRLAYADVAVSGNASQSTQVIIPRKGVSELTRLLPDNDALLSISINKNHITVTGVDFVFTSKLVDGRFPDYQGVFPKVTMGVLNVSREALKQAVSRTAILSNEKNKGVLFSITDAGELKLSATNPEQEEAEELVEAEYDGRPVELGFNASYLLDILNTLPQDIVKITFSEHKGSVLFEPVDPALSARYIIMPLQI